MTRREAKLAGLPRYSNGKPCSQSRLVVYIENKFQPGMNWNNYGKEWEIDHIRPLSSFPNLKFDREQQLLACHYTNLQPLWINEHRAKTAAENTTSAIQ